MSRRRLVAFLSLASVAAAPLAQSQVVKGIEREDLDRAVNPCDDFYSFANGAWRASNPNPKGMERWSRRAAGREANRLRLERLLEELAARPDRPRGSIEQQLGDQFASCMDEPAIDALGVAPLAPLLADIASIRDVGGVQRVIRTLHELAIPAPFSVTAASDYRDPESVVANLAAGGLGLPGRDYYLKADPNFAEARDKYRAHVAAILTLAGATTQAAAKEAEEILALETRLAEASLSPDEASDPAATAHKMTFAQLGRLAPRFDWERYFAEAGLPRIDVNVAEPAFLARVNRELSTTPVETWRAYLTWRLLESASPWLSRPFASESFAFKDRYLGGVVAPRPRARVCLEATEALLSEPLGRVYAARHFPPAAKERVKAMIRSLLGVMKDDVRALKWMSDATRKEALSKVEGYEVMVGYPDRWVDHSSLVIRRGALWANVAAARRFGVDLSRKRIGGRTSRSVWPLPPSSPDASIDIQLNVMTLPAGFLEAPAFDLAASDAANFGAIGVGVAHDITHAIDALGRDFDASGRPRNWWTEPDLDALAKIGQCTADQYDGYEIEPGLHLDGKRVLGEALGDLAGMRLSFRALRKWMLDHPAPVIDGFTPEQQFFISWGQFRGASESLELQRRMAKTDPHPTAKYRVIGPLSNSAEFQEAFACKEGSSMVRSKQQRCGAW